MRLYSHGGRVRLKNEPSKQRGLQMDTDKLLSSTCAGVRIFISGDLYRSLSFAMNSTGRRIRHGRLVRFSVSVGNSEAGRAWAQAHTDRTPAAVGSPAGKRGLSAGKRAF